MDTLTVQEEAPEPILTHEFELKSNYLDWYSEHNALLGDGYEYTRDDENHIVGFVVDGEEYKW